MADAVLTALPASSGSTTLALEMDSDPSSQMDVLDWLKVLDNALLLEHQPTADTPSGGQIKGTECTLDQMKVFAFEALLALIPGKVAVALQQDKERDLGRSSSFGSDGDKGDDEDRFRTPGGNHDP